MQSNFKSLARQSKVQVHAELQEQTCLYTSIPKNAPGELFARSDP
jgi:hypothetical protein